MLTKETTDLLQAVFSKMTYREKTILEDLCETMIATTDADRRILLNTMNFVKCSPRQESLRSSLRTRISGGALTDRSDALLEELKVLQESEEYLRNLVKTAQTTVEITSVVDDTLRARRSRCQQQLAEAVRKFHRIYGVPLNPDMLSGKLSPETDRYITSFIKASNKRKFQLYSRVVSGNYMDTIGTAQFNFSEPSGEAFLVACADDLNKGNVAFLEHVKGCMKTLRGYLSGTDLTEPVTLKTIMKLVAEVKQLEQESKSCDY